jgi:hypothetical protein
LRNFILPALFGFAVITASSAIADTATFNFTSTDPTGKSTDNNQAPNLVFSASSTTGTLLNGVTVTATAYATVNTTTNTNINTATGAAELGQYAGDGLGVCSVGDPGYSASSPTGGCNSPSHQVDNSGDYEFILFTFSTPVSLSNIVLANYGTTGSDTGTIDMDMSYWVNSGTPTSITNLGAATGNDFCGDTGQAGNQACPAKYGDQTGGTNSLTDPLTGNNVSTLLVAAYVGSTDGAADYFKVQDLSVSKIATPEPATFGMFGFALAGLGLIVRKRKQA